MLPATLDRRVHYLRENLRSTQPRRHVFIDTEARTDYRDGVQSQTWRCGVARYVDRDTRKRQPTDTTAEYLDYQSLWRDIDKFTRANSRTIVWAHNLAYDLRISDALSELPGLGWSLRAIVLEGMACWARFSRGKASLVCTDFTSWASIPLSDIGAYLDMGQEPLPADPDDTRGYLRRCRQDVDILATAVLQTLEWLNNDDLGNWQITGASQAWSAYRHRFQTHRLLVHNDAAAIVAERRAVWAGRTETYRHGVIDGEVTFEFDLPRAYATVARDVDVPLVYQGHVPRCSQAHFWKWRTTRRLLCECTVETEQPLVPTLHNGRILWPIGKFKTTLWDNEIAFALEHGARVRMYRTYVYTSGPALAKWATWILEQIEPGAELVGPLQARILKQWSRSLIGRFALRYRQWSPMGTADSADLYLAKLVGKREVAGARMMQVGENLLELGEMSEPENSLPQITGYVTAECRVRLYGLMETAGLGNVYYVDTDSVIVNAEGAERLRYRILDDGAFGLSHKRTIRRLELSGPRHLFLDDNPRVSGLPRRARQVGTSEYVAEHWQGLGEALATGNAGRVLVYERTFRLNATDHRRNWLDNGLTAPYTVGVP